jgi:serine/threonine-protein kinase
VATLTQPTGTPVTGGPADFPRRLGRYLLVRELARGGMGSVYLARAEGPGGLGRVVAVKCVADELCGTGRLVDMFLDEARIASRIVHPNVSTAFDFGEAEGTYFLAMDYLVGEPASRIFEAVRAIDVAARRALGWPAVVARIAADAAEGLHAAHELTDPSGRPMEVVHRDVSQDNVFVTYDGGVRVLDFGIAAARDKLYVTSTGEVKGTIGYMAPEQLEGRAVDRRTDVWALGVVAWELAAGRPLFDRRTSAETATAVVNAPIAPLSEVAEDVPEALSRIVARALSRDPSARYATARGMGRELVAFLASSPAGAADVAEAMATLFPNGRAERAAIVREVATAPIARVDAGQRRPPEARSPEAPEPGSPRDSDAGAPSRAREPERPRPSRAKRPHPALVRGRRRRMSAILAGAVALILAVVVGIFIGRTLRDEPTTAATSE